MTTERKDTQDCKRQPNRRSVARHASTIAAVVIELGHHAGFNSCEHCDALVTELTTMPDVQIGDKGVVALLRDLREELDDRFDGAEDSGSRWMGSYLDRIDALLRRGGGSNGAL